MSTFDRSDDESTAHHSANQPRGDTGRFVAADSFDGKLAAFQKVLVDLDGDGKPDAMMPMPDPGQPPQTDIQNDAFVGNMMLRSMGRPPAIGNAMLQASEPAGGRMYPPIPAGLQDMQGVDDRMPPSVKRPGFDLLGPR